MYQNLELSWTNFTLTRFAFSLSVADGAAPFSPAGGAISPTVGENVTWSWCWAAPAGAGGAGFGLPAPSAGEWRFSGSGGCGWGRGMETVE